MTVQYYILIGLAVGAVTRLMCGHPRPNWCIPLGAVAWPLFILCWIFWGLLFLVYYRDDYRN